MRALSVLVGLVLFAALGAHPVTADTGDRTLWLYHTHTRESGHFTYFHDGHYDPAVLHQLDIFLADWRTKRATKMDPHLFDLLWEVYQDVGATQPYNIVSSYREPKTNAMLRARSAESGVAEHSQHMLGKAMDVFIPGVPLPKLRAAAMRHQVGGVGYYPTSGSPFVHMDTGNVRAWPRMTRAQLETLFPRGKTLHLPVDGKPLSASGRLYAMAQWKQCHMVPCTGVGSAPATDSDDEIRVAALDPAQRTVSTIPIVAPVPMMPPTPANAGDGTAADAVMPFSKTPAMMVATRDLLPSDGSVALGAISDSIAPALPATGGRADEVLTAYAPEIAPDPGAERALRTIIERETTGSIASPAGTPADAGRGVPPGGTNGLTVMKNIFDLTWSAVTAANGRSAIARTLTNAAIDPDPVIGLRTHQVDFVAPEIDHVDETLTTPVPMTDIHYADMTQPEGYLDNAAELGPLANRIHLESDLVAPPRYDVFVVRSPRLVASR